jgi:hypothetical protein
MGLVKYLCNDVASRDHVLPILIDVFNRYIFTLLTVATDVEYTRCNSY